MQRKETLRNTAKAGSELSDLTPAEIGSPTLSFSLRHLIHMPDFLARLRCSNWDADNGPRLPPLLTGGKVLMIRRGPKSRRDVATESGVPFKICRCE